MSSKKQFLIFFVLVILAGVLRFYHLGTWPFAMDELYTPIETYTFMGEINVPKEYLAEGKLKPEQTQIYRLPRMIPVAHSIHWLDYKLFGEDEFGSRVLMAVIGSVSIGVIFLLSYPLFGTVGSFVLSLSIMLFPEHLLNSQNNRFYIFSFLFIAVVFLLGGHIAQKRSVAAAVWIGPLAILMVFCNTFGGLVWGILLICLLFHFICSYQREKEKISYQIYQIILILGIWSLVLLAIAFFYLKPLMANWNLVDRQWGYTPLHAIMALVNRLGWSLALLSCFGFILTLTGFRQNGNGYWVGCALMSVLTILLLPLQITFYPWYCFLFSFPLFVVLALGIDRIYHLIEDTGLPCCRFVSVFWIFLVILLNFPSFVSYYLDGNRLDYGSPCRYIQEHWQTDDYVTTDSPQITGYYLPNNYPQTALRAHNTPEFLQKLSDERKEKGRIWIVVHHHRGGLDENLRRWLSQYASYETRFGKKRFDYVENYVEVFLIPKNDKE